MRRPRIVLLFAAAIHLAAVAVRASEPVAVVPFTLVDNRIFVQATIDGHGPFALMFDTGGGYLIHRDIAERLHLSVESAGEEAGTGGQMVRSGRTTIPELRLGPITVRDGSAIVIDDSDDVNVFGTFRFAGLIGRELMDRYVIRVDYQRRELTFFPRAFAYKGPGAVLECESNMSIPTITGTIDGEAARLGLDTGARTSILVYGGFIEQHHLRARYRPRFSGITGWGIGGPIRSDVVRIGSVGVAGATIKGPVARFTLMTSGLTSGDRLSALAGPDILKRFVTYFDMPHHRVILERSPAFSAPETYDRSGMWIGEDDRGFVVLDVMRGSPADVAKFSVGDHITAVDGVPVSKLLLPRVRERFRDEPDGTRIAMRIGDSTKTLVLADFLR